MTVVMSYVKTFLRKYTVYPVASWWTGKKSKIACMDEGGKMSRTLLNAVSFSKKWNERVHYIKLNQEKWHALWHSLGGRVCKVRK